MGRNSSTGKAIALDLNWIPSRTLIRAINRDASEDLINIVLVIDGSVITLEQVSRTGRSWIRTNSVMSTMFRPERALSRVQMARDTGFFTNRVKERGVRSAANVDLRDLEALALAK